MQSLIRWECTELTKLLCRALMIREVYLIIELKL